MDVLKNAYFCEGVDYFSFFNVAPTVNNVFSVRSFRRMFDFMGYILNIAKDQIDIEDRKENRRGVLSMFSVEKDQLIFSVPFGDIPEDKFDLYYRLSQEKCYRLRDNIINGHTTSYESRNEAEGKYGGSVLFKYSGSNKRIIYGFSGMPELIDEAMMSTYGSYIGKFLLRETMETMILPTSYERNKFIVPMIQELDQDRLTYILQK